MSEALSILMMGVFLFAVYIMSRGFKVRAAHRAGRGIVRELENQGAHGPDSAVALGGIQRNLLRAGLRTFRPEGLQVLMQNDVVEMTHDNRYYLKRSV